MQYSVMSRNMLLVLDIRDVIEESVVTTVRSTEKLGMDQYNAYHKSVITDKTMSFHDTIKRTLFSHASNSQSKEQAS